MKKMWIVFLSLLMIIFGYQPIHAETVTSSIAFSVTDVNQNTINSYLKENVYYLFLTRAVDIKNTVIHYSNITAVSCTDAKGNPIGTIDTKNQTITGDFSCGMLTVNDTKQSYTIILKQSSLPSLYIDLAQNESLDNIHANKDYKAEGSSVALTDPENTSMNISAKNVEMKGRGNSSWQLYEKKGYQIKFNKKQNVLGLGAAKKWVLLANSSDASMMMNKVAYDLSSNIGLPYSTEGQYVDLWVDGDYRGTYLVSDKIEIGSSRVDIGDDNVIAEMDNDFYQDETYFTDILGNHFALKDPDISSNGVSDNFKKFEQLIDDMEEHLPSEDWSQVTSRLNVDSLAKMYLINEYLANDEYTTTSQYWYSNGVIYAGPVWDFDTSAFTQGKPTDYYVYQSPIIRQLINRSEFREVVRSVYNQYKTQFAKISAEIDSLETILKGSADMNYTRWNRLGLDDPKSGSFLPSYDANVKALKNWMNQRYNAFQINESGKSLYLDVSEDRMTVKFTYVNTNGGNNISFAFWNQLNDQDDLRWYNGSKTDDHTWTAYARLSDHGYYGSYDLHVYDGSELMAGVNYGIRDVPSASKDTNMYRLYNPNSGEHFYTADIKERNDLISYGWNYEGIGWTAPETSNTPVYRLYNPNAGEHLYTVDKSEKDSLISKGWNYESIGWYSDDAETTPLYRQYNPNQYACNHNYTTHIDERDYLLSIGWNDEGIGWYGR